MAGGLLSRCAMLSRLPVLAFVMYLTLDLSSPFVPGAFTFDPDECVEAAQREQPRAVTAETMPPSTPHVLRLAGVTRPAVRPAPAPDPRTQWRSAAPVAHTAPPAAPSSPTEDH